MKTRRIIAGSAAMLSMALLVAGSNESFAAGEPWAPARKLANAGDSISQGFSANGWIGDHPSLSWVQGTDASVNSVAERYSARVPGFTYDAESVTGAELVGGQDNFAAQANRICAQSPLPTRVRVLMGANDVCNRPASKTSNAAANLYSVRTWTEALRAGLDALAACLPSRSIVQVVSMPRVDALYDAGNAKSVWCSYGVWPVANVCRIITAESNAARRAVIGTRIDSYNDATAVEIDAYHNNSNGKNPRAIGFFTDWVGSIAKGKSNTSVGTYWFNKDDINLLDCFHPNIRGQSRIACVSWTTAPDGTGGAVKGCLQ